jgi:putative ATP-dependent endonuclease of the OLD family
VKVARLIVTNFKGVRQSELYFQGHTLLIGGNNVGKSTICEALDLALSADRLRRVPVAGEYDFHNARYLAQDGTAIPIEIEVVLADLAPEILRRCAPNLEYWNRAARRLLGEGEISAVDSEPVEPCLRIQTTVRYDPEDDDFKAKTYYAHSPSAPEGELTQVPPNIKRGFGFLYLRALRTGSRALSLERGSLLDIILRMKDARTGLWERTRQRLRELSPPIDEAAEELGPILDAIEQRLGEYIPIVGTGRSTRLFVSQLTREHLRKTIAFFLAMTPGQEPVPFQDVGTGTLNILVLALLSFIAELKKENVIFAMEEPEIALPPHTQRRITNYLLSETTQCFVTSHSPYIIERFEPEQIMLLKRSSDGILSGTPLNLPPGVKAKTYRSQLRRVIAEAMLGQGVIVGEGLSEQVVLTTVAQMLEETDSGLFPLDLAGISVVNVGGEGNLSEIGAFFKALGLSVFAFFDRRRRNPEEETRIKASFDIYCQTSYKGMEAFLAAEVPIERQWAYLNEVRESDEEGRFGIPGERPEPGSIRNLTEVVLKGTKGEGGGARLLSHCSIEEIPPTITTFLRSVYQRFPRPVRPHVSEKADSEAAIDSTASATGAADGPKAPGADP